MACCQATLKTLVPGCSMLSQIPVFNSMQQALSRTVGAGSPCLLRRLLRLLPAKCCCCQCLTPLLLHVLLRLRRPLNTCSCGTASSIDLLSLPLQIQSWLLL